MESVVGDDGIVVGSLEVVSKVMPDTWGGTWGPVSDQSLLTGGSRVGLKAYGFWAMVIIGCSKPGGGSEIEQGSKVRGEYVPALSYDDTVTLDLNSLRMRSRIRPRIPWVIHLSLFRQLSSDNAVPVPQRRSLVHSTIILFSVLLINVSIKSGFCTNFSLIPGSQRLIATASQHFESTFFYTPGDLFAVK